MGREIQIAVIPGDGVGPEVVREGLRVLDAASELDGFRVRATTYPFGAEHYLKTRELMPASALEEMKQFDAIYLGAIGDPRVETGLLERAIVAGVRFGLDLYVNLRPVKLYHEDLTPLKGKKPADIDMVFVRENTEDLYVGIHGFFKQGTADEVALQEMVMTRKGVERAVRYAYELARKPGRRQRLMLIDKSNALRGQDLWTRVFAAVGAEYPDVTQEHAYIDAATMWLVKNPEWFDVAVVPNMFGDIITDLGAAIQGGMGLAASGNLHPGRVSMFEPIHGSAPKHAGRNVICPLAAIAAVQMLLDYVGQEQTAARVERAMARVLGSGAIRDLSTSSGTPTPAYTDQVLAALRAGAKD
ncbi:MAG TPA: 3-isopropylmalate dehydrogenase [Candidatus Krumholzibacteria bacterium]|nr:3-isopropylmalate dehydrogenase [Candidatus Krumholzibacteria bacterium]